MRYWFVCAGILAVLVFLAGIVAWKMQKTSTVPRDALRLSQPMSLADILRYPAPLLEPTVRLKSETEADYSTPERAYWSMRSARNRDWFFHAHSFYTRKGLDQVVKDLGAIYEIDDDQWAKTRFPCGYSWRLVVRGPSGKDYAFMIGRGSLDPSQADSYFADICVKEDGNWRVLFAPTTDDPDFRFQAAMKQFVEESPVSSIAPKFSEWIRSAADVPDGKAVLPSSLVEELKLSGASMD
jgi:hypothetical protein